MPTTIRFATRRDEKKLREICVAAGMDLAGDLQEHIVIKRDSSLIGGAMLAQVDRDLFHLLLIAVDAQFRHGGAGGQLLQKIAADPWSCCRDAVEGSGKGHRITTVARGSSVDFYRKHGFQCCGFSELAEAFRGQCSGCPERGECDPIAMRFTAPSS